MLLTVSRPPGPLHRPAIRKTAYQVTSRAVDHWCVEPLASRFRRTSADRRGLAVTLCPAEPGRGGGVRQIVRGGQCRNRPGLAPRRAGSGGPGDHGGARRRRRTTAEPRATGRGDLGRPTRQLAQRPVRGDLAAARRAGSRLFGVCAMGVPGQARDDGCSSSRRDVVIPADAGISCDERVSPQGRSRGWATATSRPLPGSSPCGRRSPRPGRGRGVRPRSSGCRGARSTSPTRPHRATSPAIR